MTYIATLTLGWFARGPAARFLPQSTAFGQQHRLANVELPFDRDI